LGRSLWSHQLRRELSFEHFFANFIDDNDGLKMFETRPTTMKEFLQNMYYSKTDRTLYQLLAKWSEGDESKLTLESPREMIDRFYSFVPEREPCDCGCDGALEEEVKEKACDCYRCTTESELKADIRTLQQQLKAAIKRIQLIEETHE
jgi:hypothetical protein